MEKNERPLHWPSDQRSTRIIVYHRLSPEKNKSFRTTFSMKTFVELLLVFQLFKNLT